MELGESAEAGAAREVMEETQADVEIGALLGVYSLYHINQVHLIYRAEMRSAHYGAGYESQEVVLVDWADIPWHELAFPSVRWALEAHRRHRGQTDFAPETCPETPHRIE